MHGMHGHLAPPAGIVCEALDATDNLSRTGNSLSSSKMTEPHGNHAKQAKRNSIQEAHRPIPSNLRLSVHPHAPHVFIEPCTPCQSSHSLEIRPFRRTAAKHRHLNNGYECMTHAQIARPQAPTLVSLWCTSEHTLIARSQVENIETFAILHHDSFVNFTHV
jgi:hypothetical protein